MPTEHITYGLGGFDPVLPNNNMAEKTVDNGDGTGEHWDYSTEPPTVTELSGLPIPEPDPTPDESPAVQQQAEQALAGMVIAISEDPNVSPATRAWAQAWRQTVGI